MSGGLKFLQPTDDDVTKLLMAKAHIGTKNVDFQMESYVFKRRSDGVFIFNLHKTWEKLMLAARVIAAIENPADVCVISGRELGQRAILKFAAHTGANSIAGRFTPGTFTNQITRAFKEPRILIVSDPRVDHQAITEASYVNIPVIAFCDTDAPMKYVDIAIPCNTKAGNAMGLMWWLLSREVLRLRGQISRSEEWEVMPDLYFFRSQEEQEREQAGAEVEAPEYVAPEATTSFAADQNAQWADMSTGAAGGTETIGEWGTTSTGEWGASAPAAADNWTA